MLGWEHLPSFKSITDLGDTQRLQLLIDSIVDYAIYLIDLEGRISTWNSGAERLKGYKANEIVGQPFSLFFTREDQERELPRRALQVAAETGRFETEGDVERGKVDNRSPKHCARS
jgi:PAS domain S-box-containing protein